MTSLPFTIFLAPAVFDSAVSEGAGVEAGPRIERELSELLETLGIVAEPTVRLERATGDLRGQPLRATVAGRLCLVPRWTAAEALAYVTASPSVPPLGPEDPLSLLLGQGHLEPDNLHEALAIIVHQAVSAQPEILVDADDPVAEALRLGMSVEGEDLDRLRDALASPMAESELDRLAAPSLDLLIDPAYLQALTTSRDSLELFSFLRDSIFVELGLSVPPMHMQLDSSLRRNGFSFRHNAVRSMPRIGLAFDTVLVNDTPERLELLEVEAQATTNPSTKKPGALAPLDQKSKLDDMGLTTWNAFDFYILSLADLIRRHAHEFTTYSTVRRMLDELGKAFPAVVAQLDDDAIRGLLLPVLRSLLRDGISIRNLRRIVDLVRCFEVVPETRAGLDIDNFVRAGMADLIATKAARGTDTVVVYLLDPKFTRAFADDASRPDSVDPDLAEDLRNAVYTERQYLPPTAQVPLVLTEPRCRAAVREVLRHEFPDMPVLGYRDIPRSFNIQPVARISM